MKNKENKKIEEKVRQLLKKTIKSKNRKSYKIYSKL